MAAYTLTLLPISSSTSYSFHKKPTLSSLQLSSLFWNKLSIPCSNSRFFVTKCSAATVFSSLPTGKPERAAALDKIPKWSARAIKSFTMGELEARKLKYPNTGTEALLMGILVEGTSPAAKLLRNNGVTLFKVREESVNLLGKSEMYFFSPEHPPLTEPAQRVLDWAVDEKIKSGEGGEITTTHLILGIWSEKDSAGYKIMSGLGFDDEKARELTKFMDTDVVLNFK